MRWVVTRVPFHLNVEAVMLLRFVFLAVLFAHFLLPPCSWAVSLTFDDVLARAVEHSPDLAIAKYDVAAKREAVNERAYDYVPTVELRSYAEQYKDLTQGAAAVNSVGDVVYSSNSQAQVSHYVTAQLTLWDFGVRGKRMDYAKADVRSSMAQGDRALIDLKLAVLGEYAAAQAAATEIRLRSEMLPLLEEIHTIRARTHEAGLADAISVINAGVDVDRARVEIERQRLELEQRLTNLSFYTGEAYSSATVELAPLPEPETSLPGFDPARHPLIRSYDHEIAKKEAEIGAIRRSVLPTLTGYTRYSWYGTDASSFDRAREGVHERGYSLGLYATLPISEGFRTLHTLRRAELEAARLRTERTKALAELQRYFQSIGLELHHLERDVAAKRATLAKVEHEAELLSRLLAEQSVDRERYVEQRASVLEARLLLSLSMNNYRRASAVVWHHVSALRHTVLEELT